MGLLQKIDKIISAVSPITGMAIRWLGTGLRALQILSPRMRRKVFPVEQALTRLIKIEAKQGANTSAWKEIIEAAAVDDGVTLSPEATLYLATFKADFFDRYLKAPLKKMAQLLDADQNGVLDWLEEDLDDNDDPETLDG